MTSTKATTVQWAPSGNPLDGVPGEMLRHLATNGMTHGYGYGDGWSIVFYSDQGGITINTRQWVTRYPDGRITVTDENPLA